MTRLRRIPLLAMLVVSLLAPLTASADPTPFPEPPVLAFYQTPPTLPARNGDLIRSEPATFTPMLGMWPYPAKVTRVMYRTTAVDGKPIAVTGAVMVPNAPWRGTGPRPLVAFAPGTQGMADPCAPSRMMATGWWYETAMLSALLDKGYAVTMTDYQGLGTVGLHTYMAKKVQGTAVLDSIRAARRLPGTGLAADGPVAIDGYSQGGGAAAAAAEAAPGYAPELNIKGVSAGAPPTDLGAVAANLEGKMYSSYGVMASLGLAQAYGIDVRPYLNDAGYQYADKLTRVCVTDALAGFGFRRSADFTRDGRPVTEHLKEEPFASVVAENALGTGPAPSFPAFIPMSTADDIIPSDQGPLLARRWCAKGAKVQYFPTTTPGHIVTESTLVPDRVKFLSDRFEGKPFTDNCQAVANR